MHGLWFVRFAVWLRKLLGMSWLGVRQPNRLYTDFKSWCLQASDEELLEVMMHPEFETDGQAWGRWLIEHGYTWPGNRPWAQDALAHRGDETE